jgi:transposase-like protein
MVEHIVGASKSQGLFEVRIEVRRGRRWSDKIKGQIVAESYAPGAVVSEVARRHGLSPQQLSAWRKAVRTGALSLPVSAAPLFVPVMREQGYDDATAAMVPDSRGMITPENSGSLFTRQPFGSLCCPGPRHQLIETRGWPEIDQLGQQPVRKAWGATPLSLQVYAGRQTMPSGLVFHMSHTDRHVIGSA